MGGRGVRVGNGGVGRGDPHTPPLPAPQARLEGVRRGQSSTVTRCYLQCPLGLSLGSARGRAQLSGACLCSPDTHLFLCLPAVPHLSPAGLWVPTPVQPALAPLPQPGGALRLSPSPPSPSPEHPAYRSSCPRKATGQHDRRPRGRGKFCLPGNATDWGHWLP